MGDPEANDAALAETRKFVTLGMFIIDDFLYLDAAGKPTGKTIPPQIGGGGTYASIGARIWLKPDDIGMIIDRGHDFPPSIQQDLDRYRSDMWLYRDDPSRVTTRAVNKYTGDFRDFEYLTPRVRITPKDLFHTKLDKPSILHFICSPSRANKIMAEVREQPDWTPTTVYEPIPYRCVPEELPALIDVLPSISILSPNADEALSLLSMPQPPTKSTVEEACHRLLGLGVGLEGKGTVIIRSGSMGAYIASREHAGRWIPAFWGANDAHKVVDVTGAGNAFLGGLAAGLQFTKDVYRATLYATVSASFIIEQMGLPSLTLGEDGIERWNGDSPQRRLEVLIDTI